MNDTFWKYRFAVMVMLHEIFCKILIKDALFHAPKQLPFNRPSPFRTKILLFRHFQRLWNVKRKLLQNGVTAGIYLHNGNTRTFLTLLLTLSIFHTFFWCFHCWLWTITCRLGYCSKIKKNIGQEWVKPS